MALIEHEAYVAACQGFTFAAFMAADSAFSIATTSETGIEAVYAPDDGSQATAMQIADLAVMQDAENSELQRAAISFARAIIGEAITKVDLSKDAA